MNIIQDVSLLIKYIFLGLVQGFTEPIPISSSGHLVILRELFNLEIHGLSFEILVNFGSLIAIMLVYKNDIIRLSKNGLQFLLTRNVETKSDFIFVIYLFIATSITGIIGIFLKDYISIRLSAAIVVGFTLLVTGLALWIIRNLQGNKVDKELTIKDAIIIGFAQAVALIPGISRSGATIVAAMLLGMKRDTALRFSFLLFIPVSLGITILSINDIINDSNFKVLTIPYLLAFMTSIIATFYSLKWFMNIMEKGKLKYFSYYCVIVGVLVIIFI